MYSVSYERVVQILQDYVYNDVETAELGYVGDVLESFCGVTKEEAEALGLGYLFDGIERVLVGEKERKNMLHTIVFDISAEEYNRVNRLLAIPSLSEMSDKQLLSAGANTDQSEGILYVEFDDGSTLNYDLCSGQENYFDDVIWTNPDNTQDVLFECTFELGDIEFTAPNGEDYVVKLNII